MNTPNQINSLETAGRKIGSNIGENVAGEVNSTLNNPEALKKFQTTITALGMGLLSILGSTLTLTGIDAIQNAIAGEPTLEAQSTKLTPKQEQDKKIMKDILHRYVRERAGGNLEGALRGLTKEYLRYRGKYDAVAAEKAYMILIYSLLDAYKNAGYNFTDQEEIRLGATLYPFSKLIADFTGFHYKSWSINIKSDSFTYSIIKIFRCLSHKVSEEFFFKPEPQPFDWIKVRGVRW